MRSKLSAYIAIQAVPSDWLMKPPVGSGFDAVEHADVVQSEKAALEDVAAAGVLAVHPPGEIQHQLVENALEKGRSPCPFSAAVDLVDAPGGPGMHRRIDVAERPFIGGQLAVRMHVPFARQQHAAAALANSGSISANVMQ